MLRKSIWALIGALFIVLVIVPYFLGNAAEKQLRDLVAQPQLAEYVEIDVVSYDRGWFSSDVELSVAPAGFLKNYLDAVGNTIALGGNIDAEFRQLQGESVDEVPPQENPLLAAFPISERISLQHGPVFFAGGPGIGLARVAQKYNFLEFINEFTENMAAFDKTGKASANLSLAKLIDGSATMQSWATIGFDGTITSRSEQTSGKIQIGNGERKAYIEIADGHGSSSIDLVDGYIESDFEMGPVVITGKGKNDEEVRVEISPFDFEIKGRYRTIWSFIGEIDMTWGGVSVSAPTGGSLDVAEISFDAMQVPGARNSELIDSTVVIRIAEIKFVENMDAKAVEFGPIELELAYRNMDMAAYGEMVVASFDVTSNIQPGAQPDPIAVQQMIEELNVWLAAGPEIEMSHFELTSSMGDIDSSFLMQVAPGTAISEKVADYIDGISGNFDFAIDESMMRTIARSAARKQFAALRPDNPPSEEELDAFTEQILANYSNVGMLSKAEGRYTSEVELKDGKVYIGGQMTMDLMQLP